MMLEYLWCSDLTQCVLRPGKRIDICDPVYNWITTTVLEIDQIKRSMLIEHDAFHEWIALDAHGYSNRIAPLYTFAVAKNLFTQFIQAPVNSPAHLFDRCIRTERQKVTCQQEWTMYGQTQSLVCSQITQAILQNQCYCTSTTDHVKNKQIMSMTLKCHYQYTE